MVALNPIQRFSNRAEDYLRYRPGYPREILDALREECGLAAESVVADIGSGTGLLTQLFLANGNFVYGVEPNAAMREAGEHALEGWPNFRSVAGSAEATTLPDAAVDFVVAGQAFHWFEMNAARAEFRRVLKPGGWVAVIWNERRKDTPFLRAYENLLRTYGTDYAEVAAAYPEQTRMEEFFGAGAFHHKFFPNAQDFDFDGLRGRLLSASYAPPKGHPNHEPMLAELKRLFDAHAKNGRVRVEYITRLYIGHMKRDDSGDSSRK
ncbi:MAG TPA: class I SAM-dependent methyltransferase [Candidatus Polarisedimenticolia bacterium]|nr:class I SAM-dependent methyltransferase [Candidatus Polarisedimenticolia bacterium]